MGRTKSESSKLDAQMSKKAKMAVTVVSCQPAFPLSRNPKRNFRSNSVDNEENNKGKIKINGGKMLDWSQTAREVHSLGASGFLGEQKRKHEEDQYELLTGRKRKKPKTPLPIVRHQRKKQQLKEARQLKEAKAAGIVLPSQTQTKKQQKEVAKKRLESKDFRSYGPSPSIGFMKNGIFHVKSNPK
jgi:glycerol-3-phosphate dehydrogenase